MLVLPDERADELTPCCALSGRPTAESVAPVRISPGRRRARLLLCAPMSEDADRYARVSSGFTERLQGVGPDQWTLPTPCEEWTVRDLAAHVIDTQRRVLGLLGDSVTPADPDGDLLAQWSDASTALLDAVRDPSRADTEVQAFAGPTRFGALVGGLACSDTVVHT